MDEESVKGVWEGWEEFDDTDEDTCPAFQSPCRQILDFP